MCFFGVVYLPCHTYSNAYIKSNITYYLHVGFFSCMMKIFLVTWQEPRNSLEARRSPLPGLSFCGAMSDICANRALDFHRVEKPIRQKFLITPESVDRRIAYINEVRPVVRGRDLSRLSLSRRMSRLLKMLRLNGDNQRQGATSSDSRRRY